MRSGLITNQTTEIRTVVVCHPMRLILVKDEPLLVSLVVRSDHFISDSIMKYSPGRQIWLNGLHFRYLPSVQHNSMCEPSQDFQL